MKTRDKILLKSLELFNEQGERKISTNHIAAALSISPGNLYYHFPNKEAIILELFLTYEEAISQLLIAPSERSLTYTDKLGYFEGILRNMWDYRFLHRDLEQLMTENPPLRERYHRLSQNVMTQGRLIFQRLSEAGLIEIVDDEIDGLIINIWVIVSGWIPFLQNARLFGSADTISHDLLKRGIYQIILLEAPYLRGEAREKLAEMKAKYSLP